MPEPGYPEACVHELFEAQALRTPDAVALACGDEQVTYRELNARANRIAHHLCRRGVAREALVAVCMDRSVHMVAGLLGVWKAGAAYVPLDPAYPADRLAFMLQDANARILLTDGKSKRLFPSIGDAAVCLDLHWPAIAREDADNPAVAASPADLAYVMYTSGSTGRPK